MKDPLLAQGDQPVPVNEGVGANSNALLKYGIGSSAAFGIGFIKTKSGRVWDKYLDAIRAVEQGSPSGVLRTFRTSEFMSPLESWSRVGVNSQEMPALHGYKDYLSSVFGSSSSLNLEKTGAVFGEVRDAEGTLRGLGLQIESGGQRGTAIADYYARIGGTDLGFNDSLNDEILRAKWQASGTKQSYVAWLDEQVALNPAFARQRIILGAKLRGKVNIFGRSIILLEEQQKLLAKAEITGRLFRAKAAASVGRLNVLLTKPLDIPILGDILSKIPGVRSMATKPTTALGMMKGFATKAVLAKAAWKGLEYFDYLRSEGSIWAPTLGVLAGGLAGAILAKKPGQKFNKAGLIAGAAIGLYAGIAPRFEKGIFHGAASIATDANLARAQASETFGVTSSLQEQERVTPGLVSPSAALGFAGVGALGFGIVDYTRFAKSAGAERFKGGKLANIFETLRKEGGSIADSIWNSSIGKKIGTIPGLRHLTRIKSPIALGAVAGLAVWQGLASSLSLLSGNPLAAIPGVSFLGSKESSQQLQDIYSGREEVAIRKGRWWEFGRSSGYEGGRVDYYRPHALARLESRAYQKGVWGSEEERWKYDPWLNPIKALFGSDEWKYHYEQKYQYERPAPLTGTYGEDIPFVGPAIAATFGKLIKPRKEVRPDEWNLGGGAYAYHPGTRPEEEPAYELGGVGPGAPVAPEEASQLFNKLNYRHREAIGLVGYTEQLKTEALLGREELFQNLQTMGTMGKETGSEYWLWKHLNLGGGLGTTEAVRRFIPRTPSYLDTYNPLKNTMPSWIPEDYFLDLKTGNPFEKVAEAELRLPGQGYAALHPEVSNLNPEDYPLAHKVKILGDVAMYSAEYKSYMSMAKRQLNKMSDEEQRIIQTTDTQVREKKKRREFQEYTFAPGQLESEEVTISEILSPKRVLTKEYGNMVLQLEGIGAANDSQLATQRTAELLQGRTVKIYTPVLQGRKFDTVTSGPRMKAVAMIGGQDIGSILSEEGLTSQAELEDEFKQLRYSGNEQVAGKISEYVLHGLNTPLEYLTPVSPVAKFIRQRSAVEEYVSAEAIGTNNAFWDKPIDNFINPAMNMGAYKAGVTSIPEPVQERRGITEYFDMLKWSKNARLEAAARSEGDITSAARFKQQKDTTLFGADVYGNPTNVLRALPRRERDFFQEFSGATTEEERGQILELVPENERRVYLAQWFNQASAAARAKQQIGIATAEDDKTIATESLLRQTQGFAYEEGMEEAWAKETGGNIAFDDWVREKKAAEYFSTHSLPGADWIGWNPAVDMEDVKMQYVEQAGLDYHDFDLWGQRDRSMPRKPYINPTLISEMGEYAEYQNSGSAASNASALASMYSEGRYSVSTSKIEANVGNRYNVEVRDKREALVSKAYKQLGA